MTAPSALDDRKGRFSFPARSPLRLRAFFAPSIPVPKRLARLSCVIYLFCIARKFAPRMVYLIATKTNPMRYLRKNTRRENLKATKLEAIISANASAANGEHGYCGKARAAQCAAHQKVMRASEKLGRITQSRICRKPSAKTDLFADVFGNAKN